MPIRNRHRVGDHLFMDEESGVVGYKSQMVARWDGVWVRRRENEPRHPQEFIYAYNDPRALRDIRDESSFAFCGGSVNTPLKVGATNVKTVLSGPGSKYFDFKIGDMVIGQSFVVRAS